MLQQSPDTYPDVCESIARTARIRVDLANESPATAVRAVAADLIDGNRRRTARTGEFASETSADTAESWAFFAAVAQDIIDGTVTRPSVGNVRAYTESLVQTEG